MSLFSFTYFYFSQHLLFDHTLHTNFHFFDPFIHSFVRSFSYSFRPEAEDAEAEAEAAILPIYHNPIMMHMRMVACSRVPARLRPRPRTPSHFALRTHFAHPVVTFSHTHTHTRNTYCRSLLPTLAFGVTVTLTLTVILTRFTHINSFNSSHPIPSHSIRRTPIHPPSRSHLRIDCIHPSMTLSLSISFSSSIPSRFFSFPNSVAVLLVRPSVVALSFPSRSYFPRSSYSYFSFLLF